MARQHTRRSACVSLAAHLARAGWLTMLALHGWILIASWIGGSASFNSQALLIGSNLFFAGKVLDLPILRVRPTRQSIVAGVLIVALIHVGAIDRALGLDVDPLLWMYLCVSAVVLVGVSLLPTRFFARFTESLAILYGERAWRLAMMCGPAADALHRRRRHVLAASSIISRPPPAC